jgi:hypothetical protein
MSGIMSPVRNVSGVSLPLPLPQPPAPQPVPVRNTAGAAAPMGLSSHGGPGSASAGVVVATPRGSFGKGSGAGALASTTTATFTICNPVNAAPSTATPAIAAGAAATPTAAATGSTAAPPASSGGSSSGSDGDAHLFVPHAGEVGCSLPDNSSAHTPPAGTNPAGSAAHMDASPASSASTSGGSQYGATAGCSLPCRYPPSPPSPLYPDCPHRLVHEALPSLSDGSPQVRQTAGTPRLCCDMWKGIEGRRVRQGGWERAP